jgi:elongation factor 3
MGELITSLSGGAEAEEYKTQARALIAPFVDLEAAELDRYAADIVTSLLAKGIGAVPEDEYPEYSIRLPDLILAFGQRILLHEAPLMMKRGHRYALFGRNGVGKTTLMSRMGAGDIRGFPVHLKCVYVKHEILTNPGITVETFMLDTARELKAPAERALQSLREVGFSEEGVKQPVNELSGGWRMKLALARSKLQRMDILLLDEPTNHLDDMAVKWLINYLNGLGDTTVVVVSHDINFLEKTVTDVVWMHDLQLTYYEESFKTFMSKRKEYAAAAKADRILRGKTRLNEDEVDVEMEFDERAKPFKMPSPGSLDGIKTRGETVLRMKDVTFKYPGCEKAVLTDVTVRMNMMSRIAIMGENGAGKSTLLRNLVGELEPEPGFGEITKHHNLRVAFIAQHSMHHLERFKESTPLEYIAKRYKLDRDEELQEKLTVKLTEEEVALSKREGKIARVFGRRQKFGGLEYECKLNDGQEEMKWLSLSYLKSKEPYVQKLVRAFDEAQNAENAGLGVISRTQKKIAEYLLGFGLSGEDVMNKVNQLSGGQRSRLVLGAAMWTRPHVLCLDEPTNYLDIEAMDSLAEAIKVFKGAVVLVSHNERFVTELVTEWWHVAGGTVTVIKKTKDGALPEMVKKVVADEAAKAAYIDGLDAEEGGDELLEADPESTPASAAPSPPGSRSGTPKPAGESPKGKAPA